MNDTFDVEIATAGDPVNALYQAILTQTRGIPQAWDVGVSHDDGCPSLNGAGLPGCTCEVIWLAGTRLT